ncbi:hypothetical protein ACFLQY_05480 [Verrucomicrobiota bacterium]
MNFLNPRHLIPTLGGLCALSTLALSSTFFVPKPPGIENADEPRKKSNANVSVQRRKIPEAKDVLSKHLFVPERKAENMKSYSDLVVKGVYIGEEESNVVLSLKSKPHINLRVWQKEQESLIAQITDAKDPRYPLVAFLKEWDIQKIAFGGVTFHNTLSEETETYEVDYTPTKKVADNAGGGYGQGQVLDISNGKAAPKKGAQRAANGNRQNGQLGQTNFAKKLSGRISNVMQRMTPAERKQFARAVNKAARGKNGKKNGNNKKSSKNKNR